MSALPPCISYLYLMHHLPVLEVLLHPPVWYILHHG